MRRPEEHRERSEAYLASLPFSPELLGLVEPMRYALDGGKRIRAVICLATTEAAGADPDDALPAAAALELVQTFSLVHDDLPALDDDAVRRGRPSAHVEFGEGVAVIAGDALLAQAFRLALSYSTPAVGRELADATLGMIGGQYLDVTGWRDDELELIRLKTGRLFDAAVGCGLWVAGVSEREQGPWREFAAELGVLFQLVDDVLDADGLAETLGFERARELADETAARARGRLLEIPADTSVLGEIVAGLAARTS